MRRMFFTISLLVAVLIQLANVAAAQREGFIPVEGATLAARLDAAVRRGRSAPQQTPFWTAYAFDVRPGVAVDASFSNFNGMTTTFSDTSIAIGTNAGVRVETRNLGVFLLHDAAGGPVTRLEVYNLDRPREYSRYPVYWLGRAGNEESLNLLKELANQGQASRVADHAAMAIGLHDDPAVGSILKNFVRTSTNSRVRNNAVFWLGQIGGEQPFLIEIVRNEQESTDLRKKAVFAIGVSKDSEALSNLQSLYKSLADHSVRKEIIFAASINSNEDAAIDFLIQVASNDADREARKQAIFWLGQKAGERSLKVLGDVVSSNDAETEVQKHAVFALSQRPKDEAIPMLIKIAKTHPKAEVRKQAIFWLGQTGDDRALAFLKELLTK